MTETAKAKLHRSILAPETFFFDLDTYLKKLAYIFSEFINDAGYVNSGAVAYSAYMPSGMDFGRGTWHEFSPIAFWSNGPNATEDLSQSHIGGCLYFSVMREVHSFTRFWGDPTCRELIIEMRFDREARFGVDNNLIFLEIPNDLHSILTEMYDKISIDGLGPGSSGWGSEVINFREYRHICNRIDHSTKAKLTELERQFRDRVREIAHDIGGALVAHLVPSLSASHRTHVEFVVGSLLKLFLAGWRCPRFVRLIGLKDFATDDHRHASGALLGILRSFEEPDAGKTSLLLSYIKDLIRIPSYRVTVLGYANLARRQARARAAAGIMARNFSHNVGSHVMPRTSLTRLGSRANEFLKEMPDGARLEVLRDLADPLQRYIQRKADFLAEITTGGGISIRSFWLFKDIVLPFIRDTALIDSIAQNEGYGYSSRAKSSLVVRFFVKGKDATAEDQGTQLNLSYDGVVSCVVPYAERGADPRDTLEATLDREVHEKDVRISIPSAVGDMAFYGMLENIIRNSAKHGGNYDGEHPLIIDIVAEDTGVEHELCITIFDCHSHWDAEVPPFKNFNGKNLLDLTTYHLEQDIITEDGVQRQNAWGMAELAISASFLSGAKEFNPGNRCLTAVTGTRKDMDGLNKECLGFQFTMRKALTALFEGFGRPGDASAANKLDQLGIDFAGDDVPTGGGQAPVDARDAGRLRSRRRLSYQFVVVKAERLPKQPREFMEFIAQNPYRVIVVGERSDLDSELQTPEFKKICDAFAWAKDTPKLDESLPLWLWQVWLSRWEKDAARAKEVMLYMKNCPNFGPITDASDAFNECEKHSGRPWRIHLFKEYDGELWTESPLPSPDTPKFAFDRHAYLASNRELIHHRNDGWAYLDGHDADFIALFNPPRPVDASAWTFPYEVIETAQLRVLVLDERIAERAMESARVDFDKTKSDTNKMKMAIFGPNDRHDPLFWHLAYKSGVGIATHLCFKNGGGSRSDVLSPTAYVQQYAKYASDDKETTTCPYLQLTVDDDTVSLQLHRIGDKEGEAHPEQIDVSEYDIVVIHQGILDELNKQHGKEANEFLAKLRQHIPWIIVESGRGVPAEVHSHQEKFMAFSVLNYAASGHGFSKFLFAQRLMEMAREA